MDWSRCRPVGDDTEELRQKLENLKRRHDQLWKMHDFLVETLTEFVAAVELKVFPRARRNSECVVCYSDFKPDTPVEMCCECCNAVCKECYSQMDKNKCPMCKTGYTVFNVMRRDQSD